MNNGKSFCVVRVPIKSKFVRVSPFNLDFIARSTDNLFLFPVVQVNNDYRVNIEQYIEKLDAKPDTRMHRGSVIIPSEHVRVFGQPAEDMFDNVFGFVLAGSKSAVDSADTGLSELGVGSPIPRDAQVLELPPLAA